jgi:hypothetical protein
MTGGLVSIDARRTGTIAVAVGWGVAALAAILRFGLVRGVLLGGWVLPLVAGVVIVVVHALVRAPQAQERTIHKEHEPRSSAAA